MATAPASFQPTTPSLVIDGSGSAVFAGVLGPGGNWLAEEQREGAALETLFPLLDHVLRETGQTIGGMREFVYCKGPGSVLGLRLCAMAIETWRRLDPGPRPCLAYGSLQLTAALLLQDNPALTNALLVADWRKNAWHAVRIRADAPAPLEVMNDQDLARWTGPVFHLHRRKGWQSPPANARTLPYAPERLPEVLGAPGFLEQTDSVKLADLGAATFRKWDARPHGPPPNV